MRIASSATFHGLLRRIERLLRIAKFVWSRCQQRVGVMIQGFLVVFAPIRIFWISLDKSFGDAKPEAVKLDRCLIVSARFLAVCQDPTDIVLTVPEIALPDRVLSILIHQRFANDQALLIGM